MKLDLLINELNKKYDGIVMKGINFPKLDKIPFSSPRLNYMTYGGIAVGKATELYGPESGGKTTTALDLTKNAQIRAKNEYDTRIDELSSELKKLEEGGAKSHKKRIRDIRDELEDIQASGPRKVVYVDAENTLDDDWAELIGVNLDELILIKPHEQTAEEILQMILDIIKTGDAIMIVLDSVPMLLSQQAFDADLSKKTYAGASGAFTVFSQKVSQLLYKNKTAFVAINQVREDFDNPYNPYKTPGGRALKHLFTLRLLVRKGRFIDNNCNELTNAAEEPAGNLVDIRIEKTKLFKPDRRLGYYTLKYNSGIDVLSDTIDVAIWYDIIKQGGSWFTILDEEGNPLLVEDEPAKFQGKPRLLEFLREREDVYHSIQQRLMEKVSD